MKKESAALFWVSEVNLVLWLGSLGAVLFGDPQNPDTMLKLKVLAVAGCILSALLQHWAYHKVFKPIREQEKQNQRVHGTR